MTRTRTSLLYSCTSAFMLISFFTLRAQNLVPNHSFETIISCPQAFGGMGPTLAPPWVAPTLGTPDIFNICSPPTMMGVPVNFFGNQPAVTGVGYAGFYARLATHEYREYLQTPLIDTLEAGEWYAVSFYVSNSEFGCGVERIGAYFSADAFFSGTIQALDFNPQVESFGGFLSDETNWMLIEGCFQATGDETHITVGCFHHDNDNPTDPDCGLLTSYYYVDEVSVTLGNEPEEIFFDLGGPVEACFEYEIDPGLSGYNMTWEDGSHDETLVVEESGTYALTVSSGCDYGVDSVEVVILGNHAPVDIAEEEVELCVGDSYEIELDPNLAEYTWQDGSNDATYEITSSGTYSVTLDDGCSVSEDEIEVTFFEPVDPFDLGDNQDLCFGSMAELIFSPDLGDFVWQDGSTESYFIVTEPGTYAVTISNVCGSETDHITYYPLDIPDVQLGPDEQLICGDDIIDIELDPDLGSFVWQDGTTFNYYTISEAGTYTVFVTNPCGTGSDQIIVTEEDSPQFEFGSDVVLCPGDIVVLNPGSVSGYYTWQDGSNGNTLTVDAPGVYALTITNDCGTGFDDVVVTVTEPVLQPDLGPDINLCPGEELLLEIIDPNALFLWQDGSTDNAFLVTQSGEYIVRAYNVCGSLSDTIHVTVSTNPPVVDLPASITLCQGQAVVIESGVSGVNYLWSDNSTHETLTVTTPGNYSVTVSNSCGTDTDNINVIDGGPAPQVDLGNDLALCPGELHTLSPAFANVDAWLWSTGETTPTIMLGTSGETSVIVTNGCGTEYDTLITTLLPATPVFSLGNDTAVCANETVTLTVSVPNVNITWSDGSTDPVVDVSVAGQYYAAISNTCGSFADTINITQLPAIPPLDLGNDQSLCPGELIVIDPGIPDVDYLWQDGSTGNSFSTTQPGSVSLTISNACGTSTDNIEIVESTDGPDVDLGADITGCVNETITISSGISGVSYLWHDGSVQSTFTTSVSGEYALTVSNNCGSDADTILVELNGLPPAVDLGLDTMLCAGETLLLEVNALPQTDVLWQDGSILQSFEATVAGVYHVQLTNECGSVVDSIEVAYENPPAAFSLGMDTTICDGDQIRLAVDLATGNSIGWTGGSAQSTLWVNTAGTFTATVSNACGQATDVINIDVAFAPASFTLGPDTILCPGESIVLNAPHVSGQLSWQNGATTPSVVANQEQTYSLQISNQCGTATDEMNLSFDLLVPVIPLEDDLKLCPPEPLQLNVLQPFNASYSWSTGATSPSIEINAPGTYAVTVSSDCASAEHEVDVTIDAACIQTTHFYVPNVFSPNGDQINDVFSLYTSANAVIDAIDGSIYDRWGNLVFASQSNPFVWNGTRQHELLNPGVYVYVIKVIYQHNGKVREEIITGDVTLVK